MSSDNLETQPTLTAILERINQLGARLETRIDGLESQISEMRVEISLVRSDMQNGFREVERRLDVFSIDINKIRADLRYIDGRIVALEEKAS